MGFKSRLMLMGSKLWTPETMLFGGFAFVILIGAFLLSTPWATHSGKVSFLAALFTSTSAVCVTAILDAKDFAGLNSVVTADFDEAIVNLGESMEASILCTLHLKKIGIKKYGRKRLVKTTLLF